MLTSRMKFRIEAANNLHELLNKLVPQILKELEKGYKFKTNGCFTKSTEDRINKLAKDVVGDTGRTWVDNEYTDITMFCADIRYNAGPQYSTEWYRRDFPILIGRKNIIATWTPLEIFTEKSVEIAKDKIDLIGSTN